MVCLKRGFFRMENSHSDLKDHVGAPASQALTLLFAVGFIAAMLMANSVLNSVLGL